MSKEYYMNKLLQGAQDITINGNSSYTRIE